MIISKYKLLDNVNDDNDWKAHVPTQISLNEGRSKYRLLLQVNTCYSECRRMNKRI